MSEAKAIDPPDDSVPQSKAPVSRKKAPELPDLSKGIPAKKHRTFTFKIPKSARVAPEDPQTVTLRELTPSDIEMARKLGRGQDNKASHEAMKMSIFQVDGVEVDHSEDQAAYYWNVWSAKVRTLITTGWEKIHTVEEAVEQDFLDSMVVG